MSMTQLSSVFLFNLLCISLSHVILESAISSGHLSLLLLTFLAHIYALWICGIVEDRCGLWLGGGMWAGSQGVLIETALDCIT